MLSPWSVTLLDLWGLSKGMGAGLKVLLPSISLPWDQGGTGLLVRPQEAPKGMMHDEGYDH